MFEIQTMCSMCVCGGGGGCGGVPGSSDQKHTTSRLSSKVGKWPLAFTVFIVPELVPARSNKHVHISFFADPLQMHSKRAQHVCISTRIHVSQLFPNHKHVPRCCRGFWNIEIFVLLWWKSDVYLWIVLLGKTDEKNRNLRPSFTILCQNEETLSPRWNNFHGFKRLCVYARDARVFFQQSLNSRRQPLQDQPDRWSDGKTESWLFYSLIPPRLKLFKLMTSQQIIDYGSSGTWPAFTSAGMSERDVVEWDNETEGKSKHLPSKMQH